MTKEQPTPSDEPSVLSAPELPSPKKAPRAKKTADQPEVVASLKDWTPADGNSELPVVDSSEMPPAETDPLATVDNDQAVEDIVAAEGDQILEIEDAVKEAQDNPDTPSSRPSRLRRFFGHPVVRWVIVLLVVGSIVTTVVVPTVRYLFLNTIGVRSSSSLTILDDSTRQPLKGVTVTIGASQATTDEQGTARLQQIKLGTQRLVIEKRGFASVTKTITVGWGSNPLGQVEVTPTGTQYNFVTVDYASGDVLPQAELSSGEASTRADSTGHAKLTVGDPGDADLVVTVSLAGYRTDKITIKPDTKEDVQIKLVPSRKHVFMSKRSGSLDLYSVYADGKQEKRLVTASGSEQMTNLALVPHPTDSPVAYVSTRGNQTNSNGDLLSNLILVDSDSGDTTNIIAADRVTILGWVGSKLIYTQQVTGQDNQSPTRYKLMSYDYQTTDNKELAHANYFNDAALFGGQIYYAPNAGTQDAASRLYRINPDGTNKQSLLNQSVWQIVRVQYQELALSLGQQWFTYAQGANAPTKRSAAPSNLQTRTYIDSPDDKHSAWVDIRDGKGVLLSYNLGTKKDQVLVDAPGITYPVQWLDDTTLVYRVSTSEETADYVVSLRGGTPVKLTDVTATQGLGTAPAAQP